MSKKPVVVTTEFRGVFFGIVEDDAKAPGQITLSGARNCRYWSADVDGFVGLATKGPTPQCTIGPAVPEMTLYKITCVMPCTEEAAKAWEAA